MSHKTADSFPERRRAKRIKVPVGSTTVPEWLREYAKDPCPGYKRARHASL